MRILHCTDFHNHAGWFSWLGQSAGHYDLVCVTGDSLDLHCLDRIDDQLGLIQATLLPISVPVMICSGNNDAFSGPPAPPSLHQAAWLADLRRPGVAVDGDMLEVGGVRVTCIGWNARLPVATGDDIWLCHAPPARSWVSSDPWGGEAGDEIVGEVCRDGAGPDILLSGHQHHPQRQACLIGRSWCLNPGQGTNPVEPNHFVINTLTRTADLHIAGQHESTINLT